MSRFFAWIGSVILSCVTGILQFFWDLWAVIWQLLVDIGVYLLELFDYVFDWVEYGFYSFVDWVLIQLLNFLTLITDNVDFNLSVRTSDAETLFSYVYMLDKIFPLTTFFSCCAVYFGFLVAWTIYRFCKSWIPTVSG